MLPSPSTDPYDIEAIRASLNIDCPHCNAVLGPADYMRLDGEGTRLRDVYRPGFFLIGIASNDDERQGYLTTVKGLDEDEARKLIDRDQDENCHAANTRGDTFYLADVFVELTRERYRSQLERFLELVFANPFKTPTREEHAMFMAYASAAYPIVNQPGM